MRAWWRACWVQLGVLSATFFLSPNERLRTAPPTSAFDLRDRAGARLRTRPKMASRRRWERPLRRKSGRKSKNSSTLSHCAIFSVTASCIAYPRVWSLVLYRGLLYSARNIVKQDPGRARQKSLYTAIANFTKPGAQNKGDLCSDPMTTKRLFEATLYFTVFLSSEDFLCERACLFFKLFCLRRFLLSGLSSSAAPNGIHP